jgi:multiple sugar transport system ATP-binding protein
MNFLRGTYRREGGQGFVVLEHGARVLAPTVEDADGKAVVYGVRPEHLSLASDGQGLVGKVAVVEPTGMDTHVMVRVGGGDVLAVFRERHAFAPGKEIALQPDVSQAHLFDASGGTRIRR